MKTKTSNEMTVANGISLPSTLLCTAALALACVPAGAKQHHDNDETHYRAINLVSDIAGVGQVQDTNLVNGWGISYHDTFPFWVSDNGTGVATLYAVTNDASGAPHASIVPLVVSIPGNGSVSGQVANNSTDFNGDIFLFVSEDGTVSGWRPDLGTAAETLATRETAIYKGVTLATVGSNTVLLAANFHEGTLDVYQSGSTTPTQFADRTVPAGYAPFNVQNLNGAIFVTFAKQDASAKDDVPGSGQGLIEVFDVNTGAFGRFAAGSRAGGHISQMNSPWGLAVAPSTFGEHANQLLVGNFGSGTIMTFDAGSYSSPLVRERARRSMNRKARRPIRPEAASCCFKSSSCFAFASVLVISANGTWQRWLSHRPNLRGPVASSVWL
jgi:uncharacterized protein (TIGR03118 family)